MIIILVFRARNVDWWNAILRMLELYRKRNFTIFKNIQEGFPNKSEKVFFSLYTTCFVDSQSFEDTCRKPELPARVIPALKKYASKTK